MRPVLWSIYMAGGYAAWYLGTTAWDVIIPGTTTAGYSYCRNLVTFFTEDTQVSRQLTLEGGGWPAGWWLYFLPHP